MASVQATSGKALLTVVLIALLLGFQTIIPSRADAQDKEIKGEPTEHSVPELVNRLAEQLSTIDSLYCEYQIDFVKKEDQAETKTAKTRFARSGKKWLWAAQFDNGAGESRVLYDGDTVFSYRVLLSPEGERLDNGTVQMDPERELPSLTPDAFLGIDMSNIRRSVVNVLRLADVELSREVLEDGTNGYRLVAREVGSNGMDQRRSEDKTRVRYKVDVLLDPTHDLLPRELLITQDEHTITWPDWKQHVKVLDYREVVDERPNKVRWFPFVAILEQGHTSAPDIKFTITKLRINLDLPKATFELQIPDGTQWMDTRIHGPGSIIPTKGRPRR